MAGKSEILMQLFQSAGEAIGAECQAVLNPPDDMMGGFTEGKYFQIEDFKFGVGMTEADSDDTQAKTGAKPGASKPSAPAQKFGKWRRETPDMAGSTKYNLDVEPISFTRIMDRASTTLFQACCDSQTLTSGAIVSRRSTGTGGPKAYLRLDFTDILITELEWEEGERIKETYKFVCRGVKVQFKPQASDGTFGKAIPGVWPKGK